MFWFQLRLVLFAATACGIVTCSNVSNPETEQNNERVLLIPNAYYISTTTRFLEGSDFLPVPNTAVAISALDFLTGHERVTIVIHGRQSSAFDEMAQTLKMSLLHSDPAMVVILVDWSWISHNPYLQAVLTLPSVAMELADFIAQMVALSKLDLSLLHIVGFDLGAHVAGMASRHPVARAMKITGLDPAGDQFGEPWTRLNATDADFVEVIHTDIEGNRWNKPYGIAEPLGDLDFYPNGGSLQPGCRNNDHSCHHNRAWQLFAATVDRNIHLFGLKCLSWRQMIQNGCVNLPVAEMGSTTLIKFAVGLYRVNTAAAWPYTK